MEWLRAPLLVKVAWLAFAACIKLVNEPHRIEHGAGELAKRIWEVVR